MNRALVVSGKEKSSEVWNSLWPWRSLWLGAGRVWLRNAMVWKKTWKTGLAGSIGEPLFYFLGLGYGLGTLIPAVGGQPYLYFVAPGLMLSSVMYSTTIEATYSTFTKMEHQKVYASMVLAPLTFHDILMGEVLWAVTKGLVSGGTVLILSFVFGASTLWPGVMGVVLILSCGLVFTALGLIVTSFAKSYDFFNYYYALLIAPMFFFSGIFFPVQALGRWVEHIAWAFPLTHLVNLSRAVMQGSFTAAHWGDLLWVALFTSVSLPAAVSLMSRRFTS